MKCHSDYYAWHSWVTDKSLRASLFKTTVCSYRHLHFIFPIMRSAKNLTWHSKRPSKIQIAVSCKPHCRLGLPNASTVSSSRRRCCLSTFISFSQCLCVFRDSWRNSLAATFIASEVIRKRVDFSWSARDTSSSEPGFIGRIVFQTLTKIVNHSL